MKANANRSKKRRISLQPKQKLCEVECADGSIIAIISLVNGFLLEFNQSLLTNPNLLITKPESEGFIAIIEPRGKQILSTLLTYEQYEELRENKANTTDSTNIITIDTIKNEIEKNDKFEITLTMNADSNNQRELK
eukprot:TRINITY_DN543_c1_g1_i8.p1 TRINITY_DN543_c1_g1~~TRINITY_DN543_c1_g1_i8.p1  ORF type:complete len:136 (+),score=58.77 TRINITY_DN543_c1_g1_i8:443-850(+)